MAYTPGLKTKQYVPGSAAKVAEPKNLYIAPDLQAVMDNLNAKEQESQPKRQEEELSVDQRWTHLRSERNAKLNATDYVNQGLIGITYEQRAELYAYREALRNLTRQPGAPWTPDTIPWPVQPNVSAERIPT